WNSILCSFPGQRHNAEALAPVASDLFGNAQAGVAVTVAAVQTGTGVVDVFRKRHVGKAMVGVGLRMVGGPCRPPDRCSGNIQADGNVSELGGNCLVFNDPTA